MRVKNKYTKEEFDVLRIEKRRAGKGSFSVYVLDVRGSEVNWRKNEFKEHFTVVDESMEGVKVFV